MRPLRRIRLFVARRPLVYWLLVGLLALATAALVLDQIAALRAARRQWGEARPVLVARHDLAAGQAVTPGDTRTARWPAALLPFDAVTDLVGPTVVAVPIAAGEPLVRRRLGRAGAGPVAGRLPPGTRGVTVPVGDVAIAVQPGDRVDVVAAGAGPEGSGAVVAAGAVVIVSSPTEVVVAVGVRDLGAVAGAMADGQVLLAINGDPPGRPSADA